MEIENISTEMYQTKVCESPLPVIVEFYSDDCIVCNMISDDVESVANEFSEKVIFYKFNCQQDQQFALDMGVSFVPSFILFEKEKNIARLDFAFGKNDIKKFIKKHIKI